jgi:hypothetical protein
MSSVPMYNCTKPSGNRLANNVAARNGKSAATGAIVSFVHGCSEVMKRCLAIVTRAQFVALRSSKTRRAAPSASAVAAVDVRDAAQRRCEAAGHLFLSALPQCCIISALLWRPISPTHTVTPIYIFHKGSVNCLNAHVSSTWATSQPENCGICPIKYAHCSPSTECSEHCNVSTPQRPPRSPCSKQMSHTIQ